MNTLAMVRSNFILDALLNFEQVKRWTGVMWENLRVLETARADHLEWVGDDRVKIEEGITLNIAFVQLKLKLSLKFIKRIGKLLHVLHAKPFLLRCVNPAALPLVGCYSIRLPRRVASWGNYTRQSTNWIVQWALPVMSACWRLMHYDVKISSARIRERVCYLLHHSGCN